MSSFLFVVLSYALSSCIGIPTNATHINVEVILPAQNITIFDASELWSMRYYNKTEKVVRLNVVIDEHRMRDILQSSPDVIRSYTVISDDVQDILRAERQRINASEKWNASRLPQDFFEEYRDWPAYELFIHELMLRHPLITSRIIMGQTVEGRNIEVIAIRGLKDSESTKPGLYIQAAAHAREWLANMATMYILNSLLEQYGVDEVVTDILDHVNIFIAPTTNIDGYIYSWSDSPNARMWRKNRRNNGDGSFGVDLNRNWGPSTTWCSSGSSTNPSSSTYCGSFVFSEPEALSAAEFILNEQFNIVAAVDMHTFGELLLWPWQYTYDRLPPIYYDEFRNLGALLSESIYSVHGVRYESIQGSDLYPHSGGLIDYVWTERNVVAFTFEGRGTGFAPPPSDIVPAGQEQFAAILTLAQTLYE